MSKTNKCIQCGKPTKNPSWCSKECVDIYEGETPRGNYTGDERERENDPNIYSGTDIGSRHSGHPGCD